MLYFTVYFKMCIIDIFCFVNTEGNNKIFGIRKKYHI